VPVRAARHRHGQHHRLLHLDRDRLAGRRRRGRVAVRPRQLRDGDVRGSLPLGLHWGDEVSAVWTKLGQPNRVTDIYGTPTLVYMFETVPYGSLELRFNASDRLMRVNASLVR